MSSTIKRRFTIAELACAASLIGMLVAAAPSHAATMYACVKHNGDAHIYTHKPRCRRGEKRISWGADGPAGRNGEPGAKGDPGPRGEAGAGGEAGPPPTTLWAVVNNSNNGGTLVRGGTGTLSATALLEPGAFEVVFDRDVSECAYIATLGSPEAGTTSAGMIAVATRLGNPDAVFVETFGEKGKPSGSESFHLAVFC
jgi:hypothetical protein